MPAIICNLLEEHYFKGKYILLDADFLDILFRDSTILEEFTKVFPDSFFLIDPLVRFEVLRGIYVPERRIIREKFLASEVFFPTISHPEVFAKLLSSALITSKIYSQQKQADGSSLTDLILAAHLVVDENVTLITGNKQHFPSCVFDTKAVLNIEQTGNGVMRAFCLIALNSEKYQKCGQKLQELELKSALSVNRDLSK